MLHTVSCVAYSNTTRLTKEIEDTSRVAPFVVIPGDKFDEVVVEGDTGLGIEDGRVVVSVQISGDEIILRVCKDTYSMSVSSCCPFIAPYLSGCLQRPP